MCIDRIRLYANSRPGPKSGVRFLMISTLAIQQLKDSHSVRVPTLPAGDWRRQLLCLSAEISGVEAKRDSGHGWEAGILLTTGAKTSRDVWPSPCVAPTLLPERFAKY